MRLGEQDIISTVLLKRFQVEGEFNGADGRHYGIIRRDDGSLLAHNPGAPDLDPYQMAWASDILKLLNRELHHDGAWVIVFTHPAPWSEMEMIRFGGDSEYDRYAIIWLDADGDPQFSVEWEKGTDELRDFTAILLQGATATIAKCESAWQTWNLHMRHVLQPTEGQLYRRAKGERPPSAA